MLVVGRQIGEGVKIGEAIVILQKCSKHGGIRLAIDAPRDVPIVRLELLKGYQRPAKGAGGQRKSSRRGAEAQGE